MPRRLDIIVPIYKNANLVRSCVDSLIAHLDEIADRRPSLILINDSPGDLQVEALLADYESSGATHIVLRNAANLGFVRTVNRGLALALENEHDALLVNSDTQTFPGTLAELFKAASADPQIGFASPRSNNASICSLPHFPPDPSCSPDYGFARWREISRTMPDYHFAPTAVGFYMLISHNVLANHGCLREDFGLGYEEENDLVMRAGKVGTRAVMVNRAYAHHAGSASFALIDMDIAAHKHGNLKRLCCDHPEFLPLVRRYEASAAFKAERLLSGLFKDPDGRTKMVFDLTGMGQHYNGTNEQVVAVLRSMARRHSHRIRLTGIANADSFRCHGLDELEGLHRADPHAPGLHAIAVRMAQPFELRHISEIEAWAPINLFAMLDTIAEDCGPLAFDAPLPELWDHVAEYANGLIFTSSFVEQTFRNRHPPAASVATWTHLLPTRLTSYAKPRAKSRGSHVLVLGNHFAHKGSDVAARVIAKAFPEMKVVALGKESTQSSNLTIHRAGMLSPELIDQLFRDASVVVLPSHVEGFGFGFMHALAAGCPIVARRIAATEEILDSLDEVTGVFLFDNDATLIRACTEAIRCNISSANDKRGGTWDDWADGLADFSLSLLERDDIFNTLVRRISAGDRLRRAFRGDELERQRTTDVPSSAPFEPLSQAKALDLRNLLKLDGRAFVEHAYATLLCRPVDDIGLRNYMEQLEQGFHKIDLLEDLSSSTEGRLRGVTLPGLDTLIAQRRRAQLPLYKRIFRS
jgi:GT2 family glycosyltransferase